MDTAREVVFMVGLMAAPAGFAISAGIALFQTTGRRRQISVFILAFTLLFLVSLLANSPWAPWDKNYHLRSLFNTLAGLSFAVTAFFTYLGYTYWPTQKRAVNLPSTVGMAVTCLTIALLTVREL